jgi:molybdate transport system substrate-binding protein
MVKALGRIAAATLLSFAFAAAAGAAELKVFSTIGVQAALEELTPQFEKATGSKLNISWATAAILVKRVRAGENADLYILTKQSLDALSKEKKVSPGSEESFASSSMAVVVKKGSPKPDISTADAYKKTLLAAKAIAYSNPAAGGASGVFFAKTLDRMGIADAMKAKTHHPPPSGNAAKLVVSGEAELAIQQEPEVMSVDGVDVVGPPPGDLNNVTHYSAGTSPDTKEANAAKALIKFLKSPEAQAVFKKRGLKPA